MPNASTEDYLWVDTILHAIDAAKAAKRPLLVRGEPGIGKSAIAKAAADKWICPLVAEVITSRTEPNDLLWQYDSIRRLAQAQILCQPGRLGKSESDSQAKGRQPNEQEKGDIIDELAMERFLSPGVLWWAFDYQSANHQYSLCPGACVPLATEKKKADDSPGKGWVVLIDEIDKADSDVPNSLLEAFANEEFNPPFIQTPVAMQGEPPLIIITTNEERTLPAAFLRRCLVLNLKFPEEEDAPVQWLVERAQKHVELEKDILEQAARKVVEARGAIRDGHKPSLGEYIDLVEAIHQQVVEGKDAQEVMGKINQFFLNKNSA